MTFGDHHEVIVTVRKPFAITKPLQLLINGSAPSGLHDSFGRPIDGDQNGIAGGNGWSLSRMAP